MRVLYLAMESDSRVYLAVVLQNNLGKLYNYRNIVWGDCSLSLRAVLLLPLSLDLFLRSFNGNRQRPMLQEIRLCLGLAKLPLWDLVSEHRACLPMTKAIVCIRHDL
jgi:hypothetical protein